MKITRLIEYAISKLLSLNVVSASGENLCKKEVYYQQNGTKLTLVPRYPLKSGGPEQRETLL